MASDTEFPHVAHRGVTESAATQDETVHVSGRGDERVGDLDPVRTTEYETIAPRLATDALVQLDAVKHLTNRRLRRQGSSSAPCPRCTYASIWSRTRETRLPSAMFASTRWRPHAALGMAFRSGAPSTRVISRTSASSVDEHSPM